MLLAGSNTEYDLVESVMIFSRSMIETRSHKEDAQSGTILPISYVQVFLESSNFRIASISPI